LVNEVETVTTMAFEFEQSASSRLPERSMTHYVVFTDLDGTLLDADTYSWAAATPALEALRVSGIPLVLVSSKTRAEIEPLRCRLQHRDPFIVENGGAVFVPQGLFAFPLERARTKSPYDVIELGLPYYMLRDVLKQIEEAVETPLQGFGDLSVDGIMHMTGLSRTDASLAKMREYDEPYVLEGPPAVIEEVCRQIVMRGLRWTKGGRLYHLTGDNDKGKAVEILLRCYRKQQRLRCQSPRVESIGIGDSINDAPLLAVVDHPVLVQKPDGSFDPDIHLPQLIRAPGIGPVGWNAAILALLNRTPYDD
jgi:mannosyl-3-phosphoglycerate phosphatase